MSSLESPLNSAHQHAANADDFAAQGLLIPALEEHTKAGEAFLACVEASHDENTKRTLRMLYNDHVKATKELHRRISKLREENKDPFLPQKPSANVPSPAVAASIAPAPTPSPPPHVRNRMSDSQQTVDESFMLLGQRSDSGDPFNQFWKITEGMLDYLSQPVAFATAPLAPPSASAHRRHGGRDPSSSSDTDVEDPISKRLSRGIGLVKAARSKILSRHDSSATASDSEGGRAAGPSTFAPKPQPDYRDDWDDDVDADEDDMADSFCLIPSKSNTAATIVLKNENAALKVELEETRTQVASMEGILKMRQEQDQQLRDSIILARKEAHRAMISSTMVPRPVPAGQPTVDLTSLNLNVPPVPPPVAALNPGRDREAQLVRRVRELEEEVRAVRAENEKQKAMIVRFRERWEKLKESAKRKKEAKAAAENTSIVGDRIDEEPEAEAEAEKDDLHPRKQSEGGGAVST
ncbi:hypothetical protein SCP_0408720 [Sparassis crispa]|uniref:Uncharacterized protein n=1 Tax=Sparassis crispa TaxID=139825 RepID=A0A401GJZ2_9APHY|nr:hypothetical protein SCP_0408720 [Sparassis crispa]GBE82488.1 hypothetical protein SCP_0408720 [Sparassis crispa]